MSKPKVFAPLDHYDYGELDALCECSLCQDWRIKLKFLKQYQDNLPKKDCPEKSCHPDLKGPCSDCRLGLRARMIYLAALNRRDLYSESSFHADAMDPPVLGEAYMAWIKGVIDDRKTREDGWWTNKAPYLPMQWWLTMFKRSVMEGIDVLAAVDEATEELPKAYLTSTSVIASGMVASGSA